MGLDLTVVVVDWRRLADAPPGRRLALLESALDEDADRCRCGAHCADGRCDGGTGCWDCPDCADPDAGWIPPRAPGHPWYLAYEFTLTCGSFKPHFWAGERWEELRVTPAAHRVRGALDSFLAGLLWVPPGEEDAPEPLLAATPDRPGAPLLVSAAPGAAALRAAAWRRAAPHLADLRAPFDARPARPNGWVETYEEFARLVREWGEVTAAAEQRGWGVVGLGR
ncbi:hypothetical protein [Streptomyces sp. NPDC005955]|uniref:hypothetical protein n=1 Tax=Streptomyces sp. NPDC005955 TaxID=3364738 RepID=UPI0036CD5030